MRITLHKIMLISVKILPWILAVIYTIGTIFSCFGIDSIILSYLGFTSLLPALFILLSSFTYKACIWHRLPLYYIIFNNIINLFIWYTLGSISFGQAMISILLTAGVIVILGAYFKNKYNEQIRNSEKLSNSNS